jgi:ribosomal protein S18 acetylase RimI-like enzyme
MEVRRYNKQTDEASLLRMIENEEDWDYAYVAEEKGEILGYSRSLEDWGFCIYVCDLLVRADYRGRHLGKKLMECLHLDYPGLEIYVMSDVDNYYGKLNYKRVGSIFEVK